jgi:hypothetical protein
MPALVASTRPAETDLSILPEEGPTTAHIGFDPSLGSSADRPIELDIDISDVDVSLFGDEPPSDISNANPFDNTTITEGDNPSDRHHHHSSRHSTRQATHVLYRLYQGEYFHFVRYRYHAAAIHQHVNRLTCEPVLILLVSSLRLEKLPH